MSLGFVIIIWKLILAAGLLQGATIFRKLLNSSYLVAIPLLIIVGLFFAFQRSDVTFPTASDLSVVDIGLWQVFFSHPEDPMSGTYRGGPESALVDSLDNAQFSIDMAIYHLNLWSIRDALIRAHKRGVDVRLVVDDVHASGSEIAALESAGIELVTDRSRNLMHHKFVVVDRSEVWTGSMNLTINGAYRNNNNLLRIRSREIAENYIREFEEMYIQRRFGSSSLSDTPHPSVNLEGREIETYFSPDDGTVFKVVDLVNNADKNVDLLAFAITSDPISNALIRAGDRGVMIRGVVEESQISAMGSDVTMLMAAGLDIRRDGNRNQMHHKVIIIDSTIVLLGSYNFTRSAEEKNDENTIIVYDPALAEQFLIEFDRLYAIAGD